MTKPTIRDVADLAEVSINTVSRALNGKPDVHPTTRAAVLEAARQLNYVPNRLARRLRTDRTGVFGVIVADISNPFFAMVVKGMGDAVRDLECSLILQDSGEALERELEAIHVMRSEHVDSILITPTRFRDGSVDALRSTGVPFVLVGRTFGDAETDHVAPDDEQVGRLATSHLLDRGHRRIALINGPENNSSAHGRRSGYLAALAERGATSSPDLQRSEALTLEDGRRFALELLTQTAERPTAVFAFSDLVALGAVQAIREMGMTIPDDVAIVGCDDIPFGACLEVPLTSVRIPTHAMGREAVAIADRRLSGDRTAAQVKMPVELIVRDSS